MRGRRLRATGTLGRIADTTLRRDRWGRCYVGPVATVEAIARRLVGPRRERRPTVAPRRERRPAMVAAAKAERRRGA